MEMLKTYEMSREEVANYWEDTTLDYETKVKLSEETGEMIDPTLKNLAQLMRLAMDCKQYERPLINEFEEVTKVLKIRINMPRKMIEQCFGIKTISLYGVGLFAPVEGILLSQGFRSRSGYDTCTTKYGHYDLSEVPEDARSKYEFRLSIPALGGLFVPRKSAMTNWISRISQLQFFDLTVEG